jgi:hypothetical protein
MILLLCKKVSKKGVTLNYIQSCTLVCTKNPTCVRNNTRSWIRRLTMFFRYLGLDKFYRIILFEDIGLSVKSVR